MPRCSPWKPNEVPEKATFAEQVKHEPPTKKVLLGHTSPETAYVVDDYPYGFRLRCKIRYWLEHKKGHGTRLMSQTTNPKVPDREVWNKPKGSTYDELMVMYLDAQGHVHPDAIHTAGDGPERVCRFRDLYAAQFTDADRRKLDLIEKFSRRVNPNC